jgi:hypothetical protein
MTFQAPLLPRREVMSDIEKARTSDLYAGLSPQKNGTRCLKKPQKVQHWKEGAAALSQIYLSGT